VVAKPRKVRLVPRPIACDTPLDGLLDSAALMKPLRTGGRGERWRV